MKNIIKQNLLAILANRGWSVLYFAQKCNEEYDVSIDTVKSVCYGRISNPKLETLIAMANILDVSIDFLVGRTEYAKDELEILKNYRQLSSHGKQFIQAMSLFEKNYTQYEEEQEELYEVPCYLPEVATQDEEIKYILPCLAPTGLFKDGVLYDTSIKTVVKTHIENAYIAFKVPNESLNPTYFKGDIIFVEKRIPFDGEIAIYQKGNHVFIRKYNKTENKHILESLNINNKDIVLSNSEYSEYTIIGTCIYIYRKK